MRPKQNTSPDGDETFLFSEPANFNLDPNKTLARTTTKRTFSGICQTSRQRRRRFRTS